jgi:hypothetical protein
MYIYYFVLNSLFYHSGVYLALKQVNLFYGGEFSMVFQNHLVKSLLIWKFIQ